MNVYAIKECYGTKTQTEANRKLRAELCEMNDRAEKFCRDMEMLQRRCEMDEATLETWMEVYDSIRLFDAFKAPEEKASRPAWHKEVTYKMRDRSEPHFRKVCFGDTAEVVKSVETAKAVGAEGTHFIGEFAEEPVHIFYHIDNEYGVYGGSNIFYTLDGQTAIDAYFRFKKELIGTYGQPDYNAEPVVVENKYIHCCKTEADALEMGYTEYVSKWELPDSEKRIVLTAKTEWHETTVSVYFWDKRYEG